jgi:hypothetical protein
MKNGYANIKLLNKRTKTNVEKERRGTKEVAMELIFDENDGN